MHPEEREVGAEILKPTVDAGGYRYGSWRYKRLVATHSRATILWDNFEVWNQL